MREHKVLNGGWTWKCLTGMTRRLGIVLMLFGMCFPYFDVDAASRPRNRGVLVKVENLESGAIAYTTVKGPQIAVPKGTSPHPNFTPGKFKLSLTGILRVPIRADYRFAMTSSGDAVFTFDGKPLLKTSSDATSADSPLSQYNKGYFDFEITISGDSSQHDTFVRVVWGDVETPLAPFAYRSIGFNASSALRNEVNQQSLILDGHHQFQQMRCYECHTDTNTREKFGFTDLDAPSFDGIGNRRTTGWFAAWIKDPSAIRDNTRMPRIFHGKTSDENAEAIAAYLGSLDADQPDNGNGNGESLSPGDAQTGSAIFDKLLCSSCHEKPGGDTIHIDEDLSRMSLTHLNAKFKIGALRQFLLNPSEHYESIRMPDFRLSEEEASHLTAFLRGTNQVVSFKGVASSGEKIQLGAKLVSESGCMACHDGPSENVLTSPGIQTIVQGDFDNHCLSESAPESGMSVHYQLEDDVRESLVAYLTSVKQEEFVQGQSPYASIDRVTDNLQCANCHGAHDGFPSLDLMAGKLNPHWAESFIDGKIDYKTRPWLESRMPGFSYYAKEVAHGMAAAGGILPVEQTQTEFKVDGSLADAGRQLVSATGGFACVTCHDVGDFKATAVFEAPGINLAFSGDRLDEEWYTRWLLHPLKVDSNSKMPVYFDKGKSALTQYFDGDAYKQVEAIWHYLKMGSEMPAPNTSPADTGSAEEEFE